VSRPAISQETCYFQNTSREEKIDKLKEISYITIFTALALGLGYFFAYIPNFELVSATVFLSGALFGLRIGTTITFLFDILTTSAGFLFFPTKNSFLVYFILGLPFVIWHVFTKGIIYGFVLTPTIQYIGIGSCEVSSKGGKK